MAKKIQTYIKAQVGAGSANPANLGSVLGPAGVNIMEFCKAFNAKTQSMESGMPIPVVITVYVDRSFTFITKKPPVSYYLKKAANVKKGASNTGRETAGSVTMEDVKAISKEKMADLNAFTEESAWEMIKGSARSMGLKVVESK